MLEGLTRPGPYVQGVKSPEIQAIPQNCDQKDISMKNLSLKDGRRFDESALLRSFSKKLDSQGLEHLQPALLNSKLNVSKQGPRILESRSRSRSQNALSNFKAPESGSSFSGNRKLAAGGRLRRGNQRYSRFLHQEVPLRISSRG